MLVAMEISAATAGPWPVLSITLGVLLLGLAGLGAALLPRAGLRAPVEPPRDDLAAFLEHPPGTPGEWRLPTQGWASLAPGALVTGSGVAPAPRAPGVRAVLAAMALAGLVLVSTGAAVAVGTRQGAPTADPTGASATADPTAPEPAPGAVEARLTFRGVVLEPRAVGVTATYPGLRLTGDAGRPRAHLELPTWNCLAGEAPADPVAAGCIRSVPEFGDLAAPELDVTRTEHGLRISGRFTTQVRPNGSSPSATGRTYAVVVTVETAGRPGEGWVAAEGALQLGDERAETTGTDAGAGVNVLRYGDR
jgi:hypothetical protein